MPTLLDAVKVGSMRLAHRIALSPMTRLRNAPGTEAPRELNAEYYGQRTSPGGLLVTECAHISPSGRGYVRAPGLYNKEQVEGWKLVTDTVHGKGGLIFCQLFHPGRVSHSDLLSDQQLPVAPSALGMSGKLYVEGGVKKDYEVPRALETEEIKGIVDDFATAAGVAVEDCGFDGVEIHAGNGYLLQQFMAAATNQRTDEYGGSMENRCRILVEVLGACAAKVGADRVSVKIQPGVTFSELIQPEEEVLETLDYLGPQLSKLGLAYVCCSSLNGEPYYKFAGLPSPNVTVDPFAYFRQRYQGTLMLNGGISIEAAEKYVEDGVGDLVSFGGLFIANANLPQLVAAGLGTAQMNPGGFNTAVWYSKDPAKDAEGYTDWPLVVPPVAAGN